MGKTAPPNHGIMKERRKSVAILFGGKSAEHDVSIMSATAIYNNMDRDLFVPSLIYLNRDGLWQSVTADDLLGQEFPSNGYGSFLPWENISGKKLPSVDIYFPVLHGPNGEDGKVQALLEMANKPFVGANSFGSALAMDKIVSKTLFHQAGLATAPFRGYQQGDGPEMIQSIEEFFSYPIFVKPCSLGSSVGISKVAQSQDLQKAIDLAFSFDQKVIVEQGIDGREIEISVMGNEDIVVSRPGELIPNNEFYDYEDKYLAGKTAFNIPVQLPDTVEKEIQRMAREAYQTLYLNGMSRIDFFIEKGSQRIYLNEVNTIPGFTEISMFPKLWQVQGISFKDLVTRLIDYGFAYYKKRTS